MSCQRENKVSGSIRFAQVYCTREVAYSKLLPNDHSVFPLRLNSPLCNFLCSPWHVYCGNRMLIHLRSNFSRIHQDCHIYGGKWETIQVSHSNSHALSCLPSSPTLSTLLYSWKLHLQSCNGEKSNPGIIAQRINSHPYQLNTALSIVVFSRTVVLKARAQLAEIQIHFQM